MPSPSRDQLRDDDLADAAADLLRHDSRLPDAGLKIESRGRVLHLTGEVGDEAELREVRERLGRLSGVLAVWDRVRIGGRAPLTLDLGCGATMQYPENIGVDVLVTDAVAVRADLRASLPFRDASVDRVFTVHVLEHLLDFLPLLDECHRVLRPGGVLHVLAPWWRHVNAVADPTHLRFFDVQTVKGICAHSGSWRRWRPLHVARDEATVFADLAPLPRDAGPVEPRRIARFFD